MEGREAMAVFGVGDGEAEIEHEFDGGVVGVSFPTVLGEEFEIDGGEVGDDGGMGLGDSFGFGTAGEEAADEELRVGGALGVEEIKQMLVTFEKRDLVGVGVKGEGPLIDRAAAACVADGRELGGLADAVVEAGGVFVHQAHR